MGKGWGRARPLTLPLPRGRGRGVRGSRWGEGRFLPLPFRWERVGVRARPPHPASPPRTGARGLRDSLAPRERGEGWGEGRLLLPPADGGEGNRRTFSPGEGF